MNRQQVAIAGVGTVLVAALSFGALVQDVKGSFFLVDNLDGTAKMGLLDGGTAMVVVMLPVSTPVVSIGTVSAGVLMSSRMAVRPDGGLVAYVEVTDGGGTTKTMLSQPPCVRKRKNGLPGALGCQRQYSGDFFASDFGTENRFLNNEASGLDCEQVPCSIVFGEDPE